MVEKGNKESTVIKTDDSHTFIALGQNMDSMIGKTVKITGPLSKAGKANRAVIVTHFEQIQN